MPQWDLGYLVRSWWHLWLEFRPKPFFSVFGDQVSPFVHHERTSALKLTSRIVDMDFTRYFCVCTLAQQSAPFLERPE